MAKGSNSLCHLLKYNIFKQIKNEEAILRDMYQRPTNITDEGGEEFKNLNLNHSFVHKVLLSCSSYIIYSNIKCKAYKKTLL